MSQPRSYFPRWLELLVVAISWPLYRVRVLGAAQVRAAAAPILIMNHLSYADVVALQLVCPRPLRFLGYEEENSHWFFKLDLPAGRVDPDLRAPADGWHAPRDQGGEGRRGGLHLPRRGTSPGPAS